MAGGGHIVVRNKVAAAADSDTVKDNTGPVRRARLVELLAMSVSEWSHGDFHFVLRCIAIAHEAFE